MQGYYIKLLAWDFQNCQEHERRQRNHSRPREVWKTQQPNAIHDSKLNPHPIKGIWGQLVKIEWFLKIRLD